MKRYLSVSVCSSKKNEDKIMKFVSRLWVDRGAKLVEKAATLGSSIDLYPVRNVVELGLEDTNGQHYPFCFTSMSHFVNCTNWRGVTD